MGALLNRIHNRLGMANSEFVEDIVRMVVVSSNALDERSFVVKIGAKAYEVTVEVHNTRKKRSGQPPLRSLRTKIRWHQEAINAGISDTQMLNECLGYLIRYSRKMERVKYYIRGINTHNGYVIRVSLLDLPYEQCHKRQ